MQANSNVTGKVHAAPNTDDQVAVTIAGFDAGQTLGPYPYMPREGDPPEPGDTCLISFDQHGDGYIVYYG